jgi:hypothetical protein
VTGHATTSTGTESLDKLLSLGAGLALGTSLMIEEEGTTEFARSLLSCYAAEGVLQGHSVFVVGPEGSLTLPGPVEADGKKNLEKPSLDSERMKIAWRYERLGAFEERERGGSALLRERLFNGIYPLQSSMCSLLLIISVQGHHVNIFPSQTVHLKHRILPSHSAILST